MNLWIGTSGFQYPEWKGTFYPTDLAASKMLGYYSARFASTEVNYTFRQIPKVTTLNRWSDETPDVFKFSFKAPQRITHFAKLRNCEEVLAVFMRAISAAGKKLGAVLFQLPPSLAKDTQVLGAFLDELPTGTRAAFEFRHPSWFDQDVFSTLRSHNAALCLAETEDLATPLVATADFGYLRLRRQDYTTPTIRRWAEFLQAQEHAWGETFVYFKHEEAGMGPAFAGELLQMMSAP